MCKGFILSTSSPTLVFCIKWFQESYGIVHKNLLVQEAEKYWEFGKSYSCCWSLTYHLRHWNRPHPERTVPSLHYVRSSGGAPKLHITKCCHTCRIHETTATRKKFHRILNRKQQWQLIICDLNIVIHYLIVVSCFPDRGNTHGFLEVILNTQFLV